MSDNEKKLIRNSAVEFMIFTGQAGELDADSVIRKFRITAADGKSYATNHHGLDVIISAGYRINAVRATQFRQWATRVLHEFEKYRIVQDQLFESDFDRLIEQIQAEREPGSDDD